MAPKLKILTEQNNLCVIINRSLNWDQHINNLRTKVSRAIGFLKYSRKFLPQNLLSEMYRGIVEPHFRFCCSVWGCCAVTKLQTLQKLQNRAARIVVKGSFDAPAMPIIRNLNWRTVDDIITSETATTIYKSLNGFVPEYLSGLFGKESTQNVRKLNNTDTDLSLPIRKKTMGRGLFLFVDLNFGINLNPMPNRHLPLPPSREESKTNYDDHSYFVVSIFLFSNVLLRPPEKQFPWTDGATVPK